MKRVLLVWLFVALPASVSAQEIVFASLAQARKILGTSDAYSQSMSDFDRSARLATARGVTESEFLEFAASAAREWADAEKAALDTALDEVLPAVARLGLPLPDRVYMIKTSGAEEAGAAYTRQNAIALPEKRLALRGAALHRLLAHELFHVSTRAHPKLADRLYEVLGFHRCGAVVLPPALAARRITNPDAPKDEHCIEIAANGEKAWVLPVLVSRVSREQLATAGPFLHHVVPLLLFVELRPAPSPAVALADAAGPRVASIGEVSGFFEKIGRNTRYVIHPEEIAAENFALLATGASTVPSPEVLTRFERVLAGYRGAASSVRPGRSGSDVEGPTP